jgi:hypothetical protein
MSEFKKFKFVSPGVRIDEIDNTHRENTAGAIGPVFIGRAKKGPFFKPIQVTSPKELTEIFGLPEPGIRGAGDVWRNGDVLAPMYGMYAAYAYLQNHDTVTFVRLAGDDHPMRTEGAGEAGWATDVPKLTNITPIMDLTDVTWTTIVPGGISDITFGGTYSGPRTGPLTVEIEITTAGANDKYKVSFNGEAPSAAEIVMVAGVPQDIVDPQNLGVATGLTVTFGVLTGHTIADTWEISESIYSEDGGAYGLFVMGLTPVFDFDNVVFTGVAIPGPNDATFSGLYDGVLENYHYITLTITTAAATDKYSVSVDGVLVSDDNLVSLVPFEILDGVFVTWGSITGHKLTETFTVHSRNPLVHAATFYVNDGALSLEGTGLGITPVAGTAAFVKSAGSTPEFTMRLHDSVSDVDTYSKKVKFNFDDRSTYYIRKVFNTNPTLTNNDITAVDSRLNYFLGETFRGAIDKEITIAPGAKYAATLLKIEDRTTSAGNHLFGTAAAQTGWVFSQDLSSDGRGVYGVSEGVYSPDNMQKLFKFHSIDGGAWFHANVKVSIDRIRYSNSRNYDYGQFDVLVRSASDTDKNPVVLETFANCNLDPTSANFIAKKIGDTRYVWDDDLKKYRRFGTNENNSRYIWVEMASGVLDGSADPSLLPWGYYGEPVYETINVDNTGANVISFGATNWVQGSIVGGSEKIAFGVSVADDYIFTDGEEVRLAIKAPSLRLRERSTEEGVSRANSAFWGTRTTSYDVDRYDGDLPDYVANNNQMLRNKNEPVAGSIQYAYKFTLDDVCYEEVDAALDYSLTTRAVYLEGAYVSGRSITAGYLRKVNGSLDNTVVPDYKLLCDKNYARFTMTFHGGADGLNIREKDAFRNTLMTNFSSTEDATESYVMYSLLKALDVVANKEQVIFDALSVPGITNPIINRQILDLGKERKDCLTVIDIGGQYTPSHENYDGEEDRIGSVEEAVATKQAFDMDAKDSYGAAYFNWIKVADPNNRTVKVWLPPSVAAMGVLAFCRKVGDTWDAPAGYNRANLSLGHCGLNVVDTLFELDNEERDSLYENNLNPICRFPEGILIMGQKTLQTASSYLDRINVRLLVNHIKRYVEFKGKRDLFEDNIYITWQRFINEIDPFLRDIVVRGGLNRYEIVFDDTTTTPEMIDRNEMYAKIYIQPSTVAEFFGVDLIINKNNVAFVD